MDRKKEIKMQAKMSESGKKFSLTLFLLNEQTYIHSRYIRIAIKNALRVRCQDPRTNINFLA